MLFQVRLILGFKVFIIYLQVKKGKKIVKKVIFIGISVKVGRKEDLDVFGVGNYDYGDEFDDFM